MVVGSGPGTSRRSSSCRGPRWISRPMIWVGCHGEGEGVGEGVGSFAQRWICRSSLSSLISLLHTTTTTTTTTTSSSSDSWPTFRVPHQEQTVVSTPRRTGCLS